MILIPVASLLVLSGCSSAPFCGETDVASLTPGTADHTAAAPANQVQFAIKYTVVGRPDSSGCAVPASVLVPQWTSSDPINAPISNANGSNGLATCVGATAIPATITASYSSTGPSIASTTLTCK